MDASPPEPSTYGCRRSGWTWAKGRGGVGRGGRGDAEGLELFLTGLKTYHGIVGILALELQPARL